MEGGHGDGTVIERDAGFHIAVDTVDLVRRVGFEVSLRICVGVDIRACQRTNNRVKELLPYELHQQFSSQDFRLRRSTSSQRDERQLELDLWHFMCRVPSNQPHLAGTDVKIPLNFSEIDHRDADILLDNNFKKLSALSFPLFDTCWYGVLVRLPPQANDSYLFGNAAQRRWMLNMLF
jgi:hypothetical protein